MNTKRYYYISSGAFNAMYTLRVRGMTPSDHGGHYYDHYCRNLSRDPVIAEQKARDRIEAINKANAEPIAVFAGFEADELNERTKGGAKHVFDLQCAIDNRCSAIAHGNWPFEKFRGPIKDVPNWHLLNCFELFGKNKHEFLNPISRFMYEVLADRLIRAAEERYERLKEKEARQAAAVDVPITDERLPITGRIISFKYVETEYGMAHKMLIESTEGFRLYGAVPAALDGNVKENDCIEFMARVKRSSNDSKFGFYNRPTKAKVV